IDGNGQADLAFAFILYNAGFRWSDQGVRAAADFFSVIAHEAGHAFGLSHFGKIFVTNKDVLDDDGRIFSDEVKYAPSALMNALYILGQQNVIQGPDNSMFCAIWASAR
ncbi:MAG: reprolysin-like metallopeptidase, partial [Gemmatimonadaceae bacterium]